jgi:NADH-quinone oxidoreductase subunit M
LVDGDCTRGFISHHHKLILEFRMLSLLIFLPVLAAIGLLFVPAKSNSIFRWIALTVSVVQGGIALLLASSYSSQITGFQLVEKANWITMNLANLGQFKAFYWVGLDGMSLPLILLSVLVMGIATLSAWNTNQNTKGFFILMLILNTAILGSFAALDALLFFVFFEFMLIPMYFLIGIWGGAKREYASVKFFLYTLLGSIFILIVFIALYASVQNPESANGIEHTFSIQHLLNSDNIIPGSALDPNSTSTFLGWSWRAWAFLLLFLGFSIKLPVVPFHTWLPDAHVEAPTPVSIVLAALLLKVGGYGLIRFVFGIFPNEAASFSLFTSILALISIIYGALNAMASKDLKRLIAYSSVSHMGFVLLGATSATTEGISGSVYQMVSHGLISAMLFAIAGVLYDRTHDRTITNYSGLYSAMPKYTALVLVGFFAAMGIPGFSAFIGEVMVFFGAFHSSQVNGLIPIWIPITATLGIILTAGYYVWTIQRMYFGKLFVTGNQSLTDLSARELFILALLAAFILWLGIYPQPLLDIINPFATQAAEALTKAIKP